MNPSHVDVANQSAMYGGGVTALTVWGLGLSDIAAIISAIVAVVGLVFHVIHTQERRKREKEIHAITMDHLKRGIRLKEIDEA